MNSFVHVLHIKNQKLDTIEGAQNSERNKQFVKPGPNILENLRALFHPITWRVTENQQKTVVSLDKKLPKPHEGPGLAQNRGHIATYNDGFEFFITKLSLILSGSYLSVL